MSLLRSACRAAASRLGGGWEGPAFGARRWLAEGAPGGSDGVEGAQSEEPAERVSGVLLNVIRAKGPLTTQELWAEVEGTHPRLESKRKMKSVLAWLRSQHAIHTRPPPGVDASKLKRSAGGTSKRTTPPFLIHYGRKDFIPKAEPLPPPQQQQQQ